MSIMNSHHKGKHSLQHVENDTYILIFLYVLSFIVLTHPSKDSSDQSHLWCCLSLQLSPSTSPNIRASTLKILSSNYQYIDRSNTENHTKYKHSTSSTANSTVYYCEDSNFRWLPKMGREMNTHSKTPVKEPRWKQLKKESSMQGVWRGLVWIH